MNHQIKYNPKTRDFKIVRPKSDKERIADLERRLARLEADKVGE